MGLEFTPWKEWLGMSISSSTLKKFTVEEIVSHCLWEMTFHGFSEEAIKEKLDELAKAYQEAMDHPEDLISLDDFLEELNENSH